MLGCRAHLPRMIPECIRCQLLECLVHLNYINKWHIYQIASHFFNRTGKLSFGPFIAKCSTVNISPAMILISFHTVSFINSKIFCFCRAASHILPSPLTSPDISQAGAWKFALHHLYIVCDIIYICINSLKIPNKYHGELQCHMPPLASPHSYSGHSV